MSGRVLDLSGRGMRLLLDRPLQCSAAIKVEAGDALVLGEVRYSVPAPAGFEVGIELQHSLVGLTELARLNQKLIGDWTPPEPGSSTKGPLNHAITARRTA